MSQRLTAFSIDDFEIDFVERWIMARGVEVKLTPTEYSLLRDLVLNADKVLIHNMLLNNIWGPEYGEEKK